MIPIYKSSRFPRSRGSRHAVPWETNIREVFEAERTRRFLMVAIDKIGRFMSRRGTTAWLKGRLYYTLRDTTRREREGGAKGSNTKFTVNSRNGPWHSPGPEKERRRETNPPTRTRGIGGTDEHHTSSSGQATIRRNDRDAIEFDYGGGPCNFVCQNSGLWLASLKTGSWTCLLGWFTPVQRGRTKMIRLGRA